MSRREYKFLTSFKFLDVKMAGLAPFATNVFATLDANMGRATHPGSATATRAGEVFSAIKISIFAQTTSLARMVPHVSIPAKGLTLAAALLVILEVIAKREL
jgi:hypothetical protein